MTSIDMKTTYPARSTGVDDQLLRTTGIALLLGVGVVHFVQIVDTLNTAPWLGAGFAALIAASLAAVVLLTGRHSRQGWGLAGIVAATAILGYVFTRTVSTPFDNADVGNWSENLGLAALFVETLLLLLSAHRLLTPPPTKR
jgi:hypothetical protein